MGMTATFYFLYNNKFSGENLKKITEALSCRFNRNFNIFFKKDKKWLPVHIDGYEKGYGYINDTVLREISRESDSPVIACSVIDSDYFILGLCEKGDIIEQYYFGEEDLAEEYGIDQENMKIPMKLCKYGIEKEHLKTIWNNHNYIFAEDVLQELIGEIGGFL